MFLIFSEHSQSMFVGALQLKFLFSFKYFFNISGTAKCGFKASQGGYITRFHRNVEI